MKLSERAMLVSLHISSWSGMLIDREVTDEVHESYKADKEAGRYNKRLVAAKFLNGVRSAHNAARASHRLLTLPWEDNGPRVLATQGYIHYNTVMRQKRQRVEEEVKQFLAQPDEFIQEAKIRLGNMFSSDDYPSTADLKRKFAFDVEIKQMPDVSDFRAQLSEDQVKGIVKDIERRTNERLQNAMNDVFKRIEAMVQRLRDRLHDYVPAKDGKKADGVIRDAVVYDINELAELLPALNVTGDERLDELRKQLIGELVANSPEILRADSKVRKDTISKADKILKKVQGYMK